MLWDPAIDSVVDCDAKYEEGLADLGLRKGEGESHQPVDRCSLSPASERYPLTSASGKISTDSWGWNSGLYLHQDSQVS